MRNRDICANSKLTNFVPTKEQLRIAILNSFNQSLCAAECHRLLVNTFGESLSPSLSTCEYWYRRFKAGDFDILDKERSGAPKKLEEPELEQLLEDNPHRTQRQLAVILNVSHATIHRRLRNIGVIRKNGRWIPFKVKSRNDRVEIY